MSTVEMTKRGRPFGVKHNQVRNAVLASFLEHGSITQAAGASPSQIAAMVKNGLLKPTKGRVATGRRPAIIYTLTLKGRGTARKFVA